MRLFIYIFSAVLALGVAYFSYHKQTKLFAEAQNLIEKRAGEFKDQVAREDGVRARLAELDLEIQQAKSDLRDSEFALESKQGELSSAQSEYQTLVASFEEEKEKSTELDSQIAEQDRQLIALGLDPNVTEDELGRTVLSLDQEINSKANQFQELEKSNDTATETIASLLANIQKHKEDRAEIFQKLSLNTWSGRVTSSDVEWGLVVFSGGSKIGLEPGQSYYVTRGNQFIAELEIVSMEENQTLASVDTKTLAQGVNVRSGDRVILAEPVSVR